MCSPVCMRRALERAGKQAPIHASLQCQVQATRSQAASLRRPDVALAGAHGAQTCDSVCSAVVVRRAFWVAFIHAALDPDEFGRAVGRRSTCEQSPVRNQGVQHSAAESGSIQFHPNLKRTLRVRRGHTFVPRWRAALLSTRQPLPALLSPSHGTRAHAPRRVRVARALAGAGAASSSSSAGGATPASMSRSMSSA